MKKRILSLSLGSIITISILTGCSGPSLPFTTSSECRKFEQYQEELFKDEVCANTLNLHYTLSNPSSYGLSDYDISFGDLSRESRSQNKEVLSNTQKKLKDFHYFLLSDEEKLNYDLLSNYIDQQIDLCDYELYGDVLSPSNGLQSQLPMLFAEYKFRSEKDITDYLELLKLMDSYYKDIIDFERDKSEAGFFMQDSLCLKVIKECETFIEKPEENYLITTFENRMKEFDGISETEKSKYIEDNKKIVAEHVIPAYQSLISGLTALLGTGENDDGLCNYKNGKKYYKLLVQSETGSQDSIQRLAKRIEEKRTEDLESCSEIKGRKPEIGEECNELELNYKDEEDMISTLQEKLLKDFPKISNTDYEISYVDESLSDSLAPAFYLTAPIDDYKENDIYINRASEYEDMLYFATLAHEGYPGHLYQTVMSYDYGLAPFRSLLNYAGYSEGWATYVEMMSYYYAGLDEDLASFLQHSEAATLSLYASSDIGIHYLGWDRKQLYDFWANYGITDEDAVDGVRELILADPGNYLKYYVGYLEFEQLREEKEKQYGKKFDLIKFHEAILRIGPATFDLIDKYFDHYYPFET